MKLTGGLIVCVVLSIGLCQPIRSGASLEFNGSSSYTVINSSFLNGITTSTFTFDFWLKPNDVNKYQMVWGKTEFWKEWAFSFGGRPGQIGFFQAWPNTYYDVVSQDSVLKPNQWQHINIVGNGKAVQFYIDGKAITTTGSLYGQLSFNAVASGSAIGPMVWGLRDNSTLPDDSWFKGLLADFRVWDRALSAVEVSSFHNNPPADTSPGLRHHIPFKENSGSTFRDIIGGIQGSLFNAVWSQDNPSFSATVPHQAAATAQIVNGFVVGITITDPGYGYTNAPTVQIEGGGGSGATAVATVANGIVTGINITSAGLGYSNMPEVFIASPPFMPWVEIGVTQLKVTQHVVLGRRYVLESSPDLTTWLQVGGQFTAQKEVVTQVFDVEATGRFFRLREMQ